MDIQHEGLKNNHKKAYVSLVISVFRPL